MIIKVDEEIRNEIQKYQYEVESRKELISFMVSTNIENNEAMARYENEYLHYFKLYNEAKAKMLNKYLNNIDYKSWNLDFLTCELKVVI